jgi:NB-ARC domain
MTINRSDLQAVVDRLEAGEDLSERDLQLLATAVRSRQISIATGERAVAVGGSADGATIVTGNGNFFFDGVNAELILNLLRERSLPDSPRVAPSPRVRLPDNFVPRPDALNAVKARLLGEDDPTLVVSAIAGLGGIGKSVLAIAVVLDPEVQARFEDGILWVTLGQNPDLLSLLGDWIRELDKSREAFSANTLESAAQYLGTLLAERRMLLVVDDVWNAAHAEWFRVGGGGCRVLVTTREARLEGAEYYDLALMTEDEAIELVRQKLGQRWQQEQEAEVKAFANILGRLPLALDLAANQVRDGLKWGELRSEFEAERRAVFQGTGRRSSALQLLDSSEALEQLEEEEQRKYSLQACFNLSLKRLKPQQFEQFAWLGLLPEDVNLDRRVAAVLWDLSPFRAQKVLIDLRNRSFLTGGVDTIEGEPSYRVHDLMHDLARISIDCPPSDESNQLGGLGMSIAAAHQGFLERYRAQAQDRRWDKLPSDGYIHRRLTWHMKQAGWLDEIHALMAMSDDFPSGTLRERGNNAWFEACDRIGQPAIFVEDVARAWELAEQMYGSEPTRSIGLQCRYALITATLNSLVANLPIRMMAKFVKQGFWAVEQAWAYVEQIQNESDIESAIQVLTPYLTKTLFSLDDESSRAHVLGSLSKIDSVYLSEAIAAARSIEDISSQAKTLTFLAKIDSVYLPEAVDMARSINDESSRASVLGSLSEIDSVYLSEAIAAALLIKDHSQSQSLILSSLAEINGANFLEFLAVARLIEDESYRTSVLNSLAKIDGADLAELFTETHSIKDKSNRLHVLISLAEIDNAYFSEALTVARSMQKDSSRAHALICLAKIDSAYSSEAITAVRLVDDWMDRDRISNDLAEIGADCSQLLAVFRSIQDDSHRAYILIDLAKLDISYFSDALAIARSIQSESSRAHILVSLAKIDRTYCSEAFVSARLVRDEFERVKILIRLAEINGDYFSEALAAALSIEYEFRQADFLESLAKIDGADLSALLAAARSMEYAFNRATVLIGLAEIDLSYLPEALAEARSIQNEYSRAHNLVNLAKIDSTYCSEALAVAQLVQDEFSYFGILKDIARIDGASFSELLTVVNSIKNESDRAKVLTSLAKINEANLSALLTAAHSIQDESSRAEVLSSLAEIGGAGFFELLTLVNSIQNESDRAKVLASLAKINGADLSALLTATHSIQDEYNREDILISLAEIDGAYFAEALDIVSLLPHESIQAMRLSHLAEIAPQSFLLKISEAISQIAGKPTRAEALGRCLPYFPLDRLSFQEWCKYLHILAHSQRPNLIHYLPRLYPAILHLGGATAMRGVVDAMNEVCDQWR